MKTLTFYSYKGGVGRTLAASNFAVYLAKLGQKTVLIDFDLEAPGVDSKFPNISMTDNQKGILDYIIEYQQTNTDPGSVKEICLQIPVEASTNAAPLWFIPAGNYLSEEYYKKLSQLSWEIIFSEEYNGVAFFQNLLARIENELQPDFVIIDSRTGIGEIAGLCTQQLADEVVIFSSLSGESIKMTKHIKQLILNSEIAEMLEKSIDVKVVVSRVPKPDELDSFKNRCCKLFDIDETKLFFLFSCPNLEQEEFLAIADIQKNDELVSNYVRLFYGLNIDIASEELRSEIERMTHDLLNVPPEESEKNILELSTLYPHPDVYRAAMHFFQLRNKPTEVKTFGLKLLGLLPNDEESLSVLAGIYLSSDSYLILHKDSNRKDVIQILEKMWENHKLKPKESLRYAELLERDGQYTESFEIAKDLYNNDKLDDDAQTRARSIAARCALKLGNRDVAVELAAGIPQELLIGLLGALVLEERRRNNDLDGAFNLGKQLLQQHIDREILDLSANLARQLGRTEELEKALRSNRDLGFSRRDRRFLFREMLEELPEYSPEYLRRLGLPNLADELEQSLR